MGKQAKKKQKSEAQIKGQKRHNPGTRGMNTYKKGTLWAIRQRAVRGKKGEVLKDENGKPILVKEEVYVPPRTLYDPFDKQKNDRHAPEPFDSLQLDWRQEIMEFAADNDARIAKIDLPDGAFLYQVYRNERDSKTKATVRHVFFEVQSTQKLTLEKERKKA